MVLLHTTRSSVHKALHQGCLGVAALLLAHAGSLEVTDSKVRQQSVVVMHHPCKSGTSCSIFTLVAVAVGLDCPTGAHCLPAVLPASK
jgi:hypothetical protein